MLNNCEYPAIKQTMIRKQIHKPGNLSNETILQIIEAQLNGRYKTSRESDSKLNIKRLYKYESNGWETITKQLNIIDTGYFKINNNSISVRFTTWKHLIFWISFLTLGFLLIWKVWEASLGLSIALSTIPISLVWIIGIHDFNSFINKELFKIEKQFKKSV